jgi:hypothetical protein
MKTLLRSLAVVAIIGACFIAGSFAQSQWSSQTSNEVALTVVDYSGDITCEPSTVELGQIVPLSSNEFEVTITNGSNTNASVTFYPEAEAADIPGLGKLYSVNNDYTPWLVESGTSETKTLRLDLYSDVTFGDTSFDIVFTAVPSE